MQLPFTIEEFLSVFATYNLAIQPVQIFAYVLGFVAIATALKGGKYSGKIVFSILAIFWAWTGSVYHIQYFSKINSAANVFGAFFLLQAILFLIAGVISSNISFSFSKTSTAIAGVVLISYAIGLYPILNYTFGHSYPQMPVFGVAPCPVVIFTFGILLLVRHKLPTYLLIIPFIWSLIGMSAAINLKIFEDFGLVLAGLIGLSFTLLNNRKKNVTA